ncbi:hypothetical protein BDZ85DRAFT_301833 [Elsinoe ampelina]|uniref:Nephrocystin 3-like N-terminal domain-containing protein n=1 Tax=Elsinoe ampelina TaxID=302913 RepID=A0A6A6G880_9PEZI|nr:hypothetical protein BDZ85DRAFT_301833 [Elsinoe ampelina]
MPPSTSRKGKEPIRDSNTEVASSSATSPQATRTQLDSSQAYSIGWISALSIERAAATAMLDFVHDSPKHFVKHERDSNSYTWGSMGRHNIVIASLAAGRYGTISAAVTAQNMLASLPHIKFALLVGVGSGIPRPRQGEDIRLGDVVVSKPASTHGGVVKYDFGKVQADGTFEVTGLLNSPPEVLLKGIGVLKSEHLSEESKMQALINDMLDRHPRMLSYGFANPGQDNDRLFRPRSTHVMTNDRHSDTRRRQCHACDPNLEVKRKERASDAPSVFYGTIASGNASVRDGVSRNQLVDRIDSAALCLETEAAGLMNNFPCLVVKGICDYADAHRSDKWQPYASATAAAYTKELLLTIAADDVQRVQTLDQFLGGIRQQVISGFMSMSQEFRQSHKSIYDQHEFELLQLLPVEFGAMSDSFEEEHQPICLDGTQSRVLEHIEDWMESTEERTIYWMTGPVGAGKSTIARTIASTVCSRRRNGLVASFFFRRSEQTLSSAVNLVGTLSHQLSQKIPAFRLSVLGALKQDSTIRKKSLAEQFNHLIATPLQEALSADALRNRTVVVAIDALDECSETQNVTAIICLLSDIGRRTCLRTLVTCRPTSPLIEQIRQIDRKVYLDIKLLEMTELRIENDVVTYSTSSLQGLRDQDDYSTRDVIPEHHDLLDQQPLQVHSAALASRSLERANQEIPEIRPSQHSKEVEQLLSIDSQHAQRDALSSLATRQPLKDEGESDKALKSARELSEVSQSSFYDANIGQTYEQTMLDIDTVLVEDIPAELDEFASLYRYGRFKEARRYFEDVLEDHVQFFPVAAEYADCLSEQEDYKTLKNFALERLSQYPRAVEEPVIDAERIFFRLHNALATAHTNLAWANGTECAFTAWDAIALRSLSSPLVNEGIRERITILRYRILCLIAKYSQRLLDVAIQSYVRDLGRSLIDEAMLLISNDRAMELCLPLFAALRHSPDADVRSIIEAFIGNTHPRETLSDAALLNLIDKVALFQGVFSNAVEAGILSVQGWGDAINMACADKINQATYLLEGLGHSLCPRYILHLANMQEFREPRALALLAADYNGGLRALLLRLLSQFQFIEDYASCWLVLHRLARAASQEQVFDKLLCEHVTKLADSTSNMHEVNLMLEAMSFYVGAETPGQRFSSLTLSSAESMRQMRAENDYMERSILDAHEVE